MLKIARGRQFFLRRRVVPPSPPKKKEISKKHMKLSQESYEKMIFLGDYQRCHLLFWTASLRGLQTWGSGVHRSNLKKKKNHPFLWDQARSRGKRRRSSDALQERLKIAIYRYKNRIFLALRAGPHPPPRVTEQQSGCPLRARCTWKKQRYQKNVRIGHFKAIF